MGGNMFLNFEQARYAGGFWNHHLMTNNRSNRIANNRVVEWDSMLLMTDVLPSVYSPTLLDWSCYKAIMTFPILTRTRIRTSTFVYREQ